MTADFRQQLIDALQTIGEDLIRNADQYVGEVNDLPESGLFLSMYLDGTNTEIPPINIEHCYVAKSAVDKFSAVRDDCSCNTCEITT